MLLDLFNLERLHEKVRARIAAGEPGYAQIGAAPVTTSLIARGWRRGVWGATRAREPVIDVRRRIMMGLADGEPTAVASRTGIFTRDDLLATARWLRTAPRGSAAQKATAERLEALAEGWPR